VDGVCVRREAVARAVHAKDARSREEVGLSSRRPRGKERTQSAVQRLHRGVQACSLRREIKGGSGVGVMPLKVGRFGASGVDFGPQQI